MTFDHALNGPFDSPHTLLDSQLLPMPMALATHKLSVWCVTAFTPVSTVYFGEDYNSGGYMSTYYSKSHA